MSKGFWSNIFSSRDRFSLDEMQHLHTVLLRNQIINDSNRSTVVEALRSISELVIWGDQQDSTIVEYFLTENILGHFHQILLQKSNRSGNIAIQVLQTLSILLQNVKNQQTIYYLFSNDHINKIVTLRFDFNDDELLGYYINLLKTISLRLNESTVQFFFHSTSITMTTNTTQNNNNTNNNTNTNSIASIEDASNAIDTLSLNNNNNNNNIQQHHVFPLYTEAIKFINHKDGMVRAAVKTLTLNVFAIQLPPLQSFLCNHPMCTQLFQDIAQYTSNQCLQLNRLLSSWELPPTNAVAAVEACLAEIEDVLAYCNDVMMVGMPVLSSMLIDELWRGVVGPIIYWPLIECNSSNGSSNGNGDGGDNNSKDNKNDANNGDGGDSNNKDDTNTNNDKSVVGPLCSLFVLERFLYASTDSSILAFIVSALLGTSSIIIEETADVLLNTIQKNNNNTTNKDNNNNSNASSFKQQQQQQSPSPSPSIIASTILTKRKLLHGCGINYHHNTPSCRQVMLCMLRGTHDAQIISASYRVIATIIGHRYISEECLDSVGLLALKRRKQLQLISDLLAQNSSTIAVDSSNNSQGDNSNSGNDNSSDTTIVDTKDNSNTTNTSSTQYDEIVTAIIDGIGVDTLSPGSIEIAGWILYQLLIIANNNTNSSTTTTIDDNTNINTTTNTTTPLLLLQSVLNTSITTVHTTLRYQWADAVLPIILFFWPRIRSSILHRSGSGAVYIAAQTWIQGVLLQELQWSIIGTSNGSSNGSNGSSNGSNNSDGKDVQNSLRENIAIAAKHTCSSVRRFVTLLQIDMMMKQGNIPEQPPFIINNSTTTTTNILLDEIGRYEMNEERILSFPSTESSSSSVECDDDRIWRCSVAFRQGQERTVILKTHYTTISDSSDGNNNSSNTTTDNNIKSLLRSPVAVLVDPGEPITTTINTATMLQGRVLSSAPLFAVDAHIDQQHPEWLHIRVRPPLSSLLRVLHIGSSSGIELATIDKHIASGHWVLAFDRKESANNAYVALSGCAEAMHVRYEIALSKLLIPSSSTNNTIDDDE